ncbi:MAG: long-chain fatty acid--CoA ligase [Deltaproteobacteria bacterium]|nr:long-chain fatty acid--CoA ligase [Deltaproteobacteria bacterium]
MDPKAVYLSKPWLKYYPEGVAAELDIPVRSIPEIFDEVSDRLQDKTALLFYGKKINYKNLREQADRFAAALADVGVAKGDRVALYLLNCPQYVIAYFGALKAGAAITPISPVYTSREVKHQLEDSGARTVVCQDILYDNVLKTGLELKNVILTNISEYLPGLKKLLGKSAFGKMSRERGAQTVQFEEGPGRYLFQSLLKKYPPSPPKIVIEPEQDIAALPYTGGTTGLPKAAILTHYNIISCQAMALAFWSSMLEEGKEVNLAFLPFFHIYGQVVVMLTSLIHGFTLVLFTTPDMDDILAAIERYQASGFYGVPTLYEYLKEYDKTDQVNWKRLKLIVCGADSLHESTVRDWERRTGTKIHEGYGMTETSAVSHATPLGLARTGSFGIPIPNQKAAVVSVEGVEFMPVGEEGELILSGPNIMQGYWKREEETREALIRIDGEKWLRTGDLVRMDEDGFFHFFDRKRDLIKYKGYSVFARHVEEVLYHHPKVKAAGVVGVPDPKVGQIIKAYVVLQSEARGKISEDQLKEYCKEKLAHYKVPKIIEFRGELPKTDVGKVSRRELREEAAGS